MYHTKTVSEVLDILQTSHENGLTEEEAQKRLSQYGLNELPEPKKESLLLMFLSEFKDILVLLLIGAAVISFFLGEKTDAIAILAIVIINAVIGFIQEYKAEKAIEALKKLSAPYSKAVRSGEAHKIESKYIVPGDIILIEAGDKVPADSRIIEAINLEVSEASLTGESLPVKKTEDKLENENLTLGDQKNILFKDTSVTYGRGVAVVYATGALTEVGKISSLLKEEKSPQTPLQLELEKVGKNLSAGAIAIIILIFLLEIFLSFESLRLAFLTSVSLAVAAIPEGLPAVITIVLAIGVTRLAKKKAIIRKLPAVETLGATTHILTDKTGTLTQNRMVVTKIYLENGNTYKIDGEGYKPEGNFYINESFKINPKESPPLMKILETGALCSNASVNFDKNKNAWEVVGNITEGALIVAAKKARIDEKALNKSRKRIFEILFSSDSKYMLTVNEIEDSDKLAVLIKGAPEIILEFCKISQDEKEKTLLKINEFTSMGLRSLGFAYKEIRKEELSEVKAGEIKDLTYLGVMSQHDPLRSEVKEAVKLARRAGITTIMVTGDHKLTAKAIAMELSIIEDESEVMTGEELEGLSEEELSDVVKKIKVYARVSPEQKLKLVKAVKLNGHIAAVTGDGVNDAPAIKAADIGISMGIEGTDVAKETSDMVLSNDNYATIVIAISEGRTIFDNLIKFITYLISCNIAEIFVVAAAAIARLPLPLLPIHLLWINIVTDGFPSLALGMEPGESDVMERNPRDTKKGILTKERWVILAVEGFIMGLSTFLLFRHAFFIYGIEVARTLAFVGLNLAELVHSLNSRSETKSLFAIGIIKNKPLFLAFTLSVLVQIPVIYTGFGDALFNAVPLSLNQAAPLLLASLVPFIAVEVIKLLKRRKVIFQ